jgi:uncharacterized protein YpuA (DUF1002 family)
VFQFKALIAQDADEDDVVYCIDFTKVQGGMNHFNETFKKIR